MRCLVPGETGIEPLVDRPDLLTGFASNLRDDEDPVEQHALVNDCRKRRGPASIHMHQPRSQELAIEIIVGMRMLIPHHLEARERADRRAGHHIARPVRLVVYAGYPGERCTAIQDWTEDP